MELEEWREKVDSAGYAHFDRKTSLHSKKTWDYITNPDKVKSHSFKPFINYNQIFYRYSKEGGVKPKSRPIAYSSHLDRAIYQYYGYLLNEKYNIFAEEKGFNESIVAYRTNLHKNNIHFAKDAFDFIQQEDCDIIVGDFKGFFDNLNHKYMKRMLMHVLGVSELSDDWYAVYKNITKFSTWELLSILKINGLVTDDFLTKMEQEQVRIKNKEVTQTKKIRKYLEKLEEKRKKLNQLETVLTKEQYQSHKKGNIKTNDGNIGIPQGSAISAVLSNVYMQEVDQKIHSYISVNNGLYLRYSDDFIVVIPKTSGKQSDEVRDFIYDIVKRTKGLKLQYEKTQIFSYSNEKLINTTGDEEIDGKLDYLGFVFDGKEVTLRAKTVSKYYYRMHRKLNTIKKCNGITKQGNKVSYHELYRVYSQKGALQKEKTSNNYEKTAIIGRKDYSGGNFFSYIQKADSIFNKEHVDFVKAKKKNPNVNLIKPTGVKQPITRCTQRHFLKIRRVRDEIDSKNVQK